MTIALPLTVFFKLFWPFIWLLNVASNLLVRALGIQPASESDQMHSEDELRLILAESAAGGELSRRERLMMENVLDLENKVARQVMVPRRDIVYLNARRSWDENLRLVAESRHTRFPLCDGDLDRVIGMVHTKDLLDAVTDNDEPPSLMKLARKLPFLPETMRLDVMLREFQRNRTHVAMVVDEFGTVSGMVTFENVLEELVGPIQDEFDRELPQVIRRGEGRYLVDATCPLYDLIEECHVDLPEVSADTTGGMMVELLGHIPQVGERVRIGRFDFTILDAEPTRVLRVEVQELEPSHRRDSGEMSDADIADSESTTETLGAAHRNGSHAGDNGRNRSQKSNRPPEQGPA
jgi:CBS domain containing-hemolysin-like protein